MSVVADHPDPVRPDLVRPQARSRGSEPARPASAPSPAEPDSPPGADSGPARPPRTRTRAQGGSLLDARHHQGIRDIAIVQSVEVHQ